MKKKETVKISLPKTPQKKHQGTSNYPKLCVTLPRQNAHLLYVNCAFASVASLDAEMIKVPITLPDSLKTIPKYFPHHRCRYFRKPVSQAVRAYALYRR